MSWLPKPIKLQKNKGVTVLEDGSPNRIELRRLDARDDSLRGAQRGICCDCNLEHLHDYELRREGKRWWLVMRSWRVD